MKLLINTNNTIVDIAEKENEVHSSLTWVTTSETTAILGDAYIDGSIVAKDVTEATVAELRYQAYPTVEDQLDMLFHAIEAGTLDTTSEFFTTLKAVKDANPKA